MDAWGWGATLAGGALVVATLLDLLITITHPNAEGPLTKRVQRAIWRAAIRLALRREGGSRRVLAAAGPALIAAAIVAWAAGLVVGFALVWWPHLGAGVAASGSPASTGLLDALYFSGVTGFTLGYGDITPRTVPLRLVAVLEAAAGLALVTAGITYVFTVMGGVARRQTLALRVHMETDGTGEGARLVAMSADVEGAAGLADRLGSLAADLRSVEERLRRYPVLTFYYRGRDAVHDPEPMLRALVEAALAAGLLARDPRYREAALTAGHLQDTLEHFMAIMAAQYLPPRVAEALDAPAPGEAARRRVHEVDARLADALGDAYDAGDAEVPQEALDLAYRERWFMDALEELTAWRDLQSGRWERDGAA